MRVIEGRDTERFDITDYMKNFSRESQTRDPQIDRNKNKLTLADLKNYTSKTNRTFIKNTAEDDY